MDYNKINFNNKAIDRLVGRIQKLEGKQKDATNLHLSAIDNIGLLEEGAVNSNYNKRMAVKNLKKANRIAPRVARLRKKLEKKGGSMPGQG